MSKEDYIPKWLQKRFPDKQDYFTVHTIVPDPLDQEGSRILKKPRKVTGDLWAHKSGCVCEACNNNWMSVIQRQTKSVLEKLLFGQDPFTFSVAEIDQLCMWMAMTAISFDAVRGVPPAISNIDRQFFHRHKMPPHHWQLYIGTYHGKNWQKENRIDLGSLRQGPVQLAMEAITIVLPPLFIHIFTHERLDFEFDYGQLLPSCGLQKTWPTLPSSLHWPTQILDDDTADEISICLTRWLGEKEGHSTYFARVKDE